MLTYREGKLFKAVTRGNGEIGEVVTSNARMFTNLPVAIDFKGRLVLRGEAVISYPDFEKINETITDDGAKYKNPRNLCSGSVRQLSNKVTAERHVRFYGFSLVSAEGGGECFAEAGCLGGNDVKKRTALNAGEDCLINLLCELLAAENHTAARTAEGLMRGGGDDIRRGNGRGMLAGSHKTCNVRHIHHEISADLIGNRAEACEINDTGICRCTRNDQAGLVLHGKALDLVVIDKVGFFINAVGDEVIVKAGKIDGASVR